VIYVKNRYAVLTHLPELLADGAAALVRPVLLQLVSTIWAWRGEVVAVCLTRLTAPLFAAAQRHREEVNEWSFRWAEWASSLNPHTEFIADPAMLRAA